jgi:hypothetical protein
VDRDPKRDESRLGAHIEDLKVFMIYYEKENPPVKP